MALDAKISFLGQTERKCADTLTKNDLEKIMQIISDVLEGFEINERERVGEEQTDDLLDSFLSALRVQGRSEKTIARYAYIIGKFSSFVNISTRKINVYHIRNWLANEKKRGVADSTLESNRQVLSSYFGWLFRESLIEKNPMVNAGAIKVPKKQKKTYSEVDFEKLNQSCKTIRDRAIINFLASTGCRVSEMTSLNRDEVDLKSLECVVHGKGNKERTVYMDAVTGMLITIYLNRRSDDSEALFVGKGAKRLQPGGVRNMLKHLGEAAEIDHVHPHKFRRTLATELTRHGMPIQEVASILGHEKLDTTMKYVVLNKDDVKTAYRRYA